jgi:uncharacterized protein YbaP (TraB family)
MVSSGQLAWENDIKGYVPSLEDRERLMVEFGIIGNHEMVQKESSNYELDDSKNSKSRIRKTTTKKMERGAPPVVL